jgi:hypothetical protein
MPYGRYFISGDRLVDCDVCGRTWRRTQMRKGVGQQKGLTVCPDDFDGIHPLDLPIRNRPEGKLEEIR